MRQRTNKRYEGREVGRQNEFNAGEETSWNRRWNINFGEARESENQSVFKQATRIISVVKVLTTYTSHANAKSRIDKQVSIQVLQASEKAILSRQWEKASTNQAFFLKMKKLGENWEKKGKKQNSQAAVVHGHQGGSKRLGDRKAREVSGTTDGSGC